MELFVLIFFVIILTIIFGIVSLVLGIFQYLSICIPDKTILEKSLG